MYKKIKNYLTNKFILGALGLVVVVLVVSSVTKKRAAPETLVVQAGSVVEEVSVTGKVAPFAKADLGFEEGGVVTKINVKVGDAVGMGDTLASLDTTDASATLVGAQASLLAEQARLSELRKGLRSEELSVEEAKIASAATDREDGQIGLMNGFHDAYVKTEDALTNYVDELFDNPQSVLPRITINAGSVNREREVNAARAAVGKDMKAWKAKLDAMTPESDPALHLDAVHGYILRIKSFLSLMSAIVNDLSVKGSGLTQAEIDAYVSDVNASLSVFNTAVSSLASAEANYRSSASAYSVAEEQYLLKKAGATPEALQTQEAKVAQARASVLSAQAQLSRKIIRAPIAGVVSKAEPHLGEFVPAGEIVFGVIGGASYKVEVNVPEVDIVKISLGDRARIMLDAYDTETIFEGSVVSIDPAETIIEGIPTYEVTLQFDSEDSRVRSGLTANIDIITEMKEGVIAIPFRAVIRKDTKDYVRLLDTATGEYAEVPITVGTRGSDGMVEVLSGITLGDTIVVVVP